MTFNGPFPDGLYSNDPTSPRYSQRGSSHNVPELSARSRRPPIPMGNGQPSEQRFNQNHVLHHSSMQNPQHSRPIEHSGYPRGQAYSTGYPPGQFYSTGYPQQSPLQPSHPQDYREHAVYSNYSSFDRRPSGYSRQSQSSRQNQSDQFRTETSITYDQPIRTAAFQEVHRKSVVHSGHYHGISNTENPASYNNHPRKDRTRHHEQGESHDPYNSDGYGHEVQLPWSEEKIGMEADEFMGHITSGLKTIDRTTQVFMNKLAKRSFSGQGDEEPADEICKIFDELMFQGILNAGGKVHLNTFRMPKDSDSSDLLRVTVSSSQKRKTFCISLDQDYILDRKDGNLKTNHSGKCIVLLLAGAWSIVLHKIYHGTRPNGTSNGEEVIWLGSTTHPISEKMRALFELGYRAVANQAGIATTAVFSDAFQDVEKVYSKDRPPPRPRSDNLSIVAGVELFLKDFAGKVQAISGTEHTALEGYTTFDVDNKRDMKKIAWIRELIDRALFQGKLDSHIDLKFKASREMRATNPDFYWLNVKFNPSDDGDFSATITIDKEHFQGNFGLFYLNFIVAALFSTEIETYLRSNWTEETLSDQDIHKKLFRGLVEAATTKGGFGKIPCAPTINELFGVLHHNIIFGIEQQEASRHRHRRR